MRRATWILLAAVLVINVGAQAYSLPVTDFIRHRSTSVTTDTLLRFGYFALMLATAFLEALLFDELVYRGAWRRRFFGGERQRRDGQELPPQDPAAALTDEALSDEDFEQAIQKEGRGWRRLVAENSVPFFLAFFVLLGGNILLFNSLNGWFDAYYSKVGHLITQLRSDDAEARRKAILGISYHRGAKIERLIVKRLAEGTPTEKVWAAWALGYRRKIDLPPADGETMDQGELLLVELLQKGTARQQRVATVAVARYIEFRKERATAKSLPALHALLDQQRKRGDIPVETVLAMGWLRQRDTVGVLATLLTAPDPRPAGKGTGSGGAEGSVGRADDADAKGDADGDRDGGVDITRATAAAWALGRMQHLVSVKPLLAGLSEAPPQVRCGIVDALGRLGHAALISKALMDEFVRKQSDFVCHKQAVVLRPDGRGERIHDKVHLVGSASRYRLRILRVMNKIGFLDDALPWLERIGADHSPYHKLVRRYARSRYRALKRLIEQDR